MTDSTPDALDAPIKGLPRNITPRRRLPPVDDWHPDVSRDIDMRIAADGTWYYLGTPINRPAMVNLFASIMRREADGRYYLVTPVEKCAISVDDAPFVAVAMSVSGTGAAQSLVFTTNTGDEVRVDKNHPIRFERQGDVFKPYVMVRRGLEALANRAVYYDLMQQCETRATDGEDWIGLWSGAIFWPMVRASQIGDTQ